MKPLPHYSFYKFFKYHGDWSDSTFGKNYKGSLKHLKKEIKEALKKPDDLMEYVDIFLLTIDCFRRRGGSAEDFLKMAFDKLEICKKRSWEKGKDGVCERKGKRK